MGKQIRLAASTLTLYLLQRTQPPGKHTDEALAFVVAAASEEDARAAACGRAGDEGAVPWADPAGSRCEPVGTAFPSVLPGVVLGDWQSQGGDRHAT